MTAGPVWLLDVDGVVNASRPGWGAPPWSRQILADGVAWQFRWAPAVTAFIREVALDGVAEVRWSTTWIPWAADVERAFGLPPLGLAFEPELAREDVDARKTEAALSVVEVERRPLVWTDDAVVPSFGPLRERLESASVPALLIAPAPRAGLQPSDIDAIRGFLAAHAG